jgi:transcriptional regulator with XRE-family HTH domain
MIYDNVKALADKRKISIAELERKAKLGNGTIGGWKDSNPNLESLNKVAKALDVNVTTLLKNR